VVAGGSSVQGEMIDAEIHRVMLKKIRFETLLMLAVAGVGLIILLVAGLWGFMALTATPLHPKTQDIPSAMASAPSPKWATAVELARQHARAAVTEKNLPGLSVAIGVDGEVVWAEAFGWADYEERTPVTPDIRFRIGTASMAMTSAAAGLLVERGQLKLDDEIQTYVPDYPRKQWPVTLRQLMAHTAGVRTDAGDEGPYGERCERTVEGLKLFGHQSLLFEPGTRYRFSSFGWILVSAAVEAAGRERFESFMRSQIFEPLGMADTRPDSIEAIPRRVTFYFPRFAADPKYGYQWAPRVDYSCYSGAAAFLSTPSDLVRFGMAINSGKLLQPATVQLLQTSARLPSGAETGYGLGWDLETVTFAGEPTRVVGHDGDSVGGIVASLLIFRERGIVVAVTSNTSYSDTAEIALKIAQAFTPANAAR
jgi:serine beta-lactamase-like protein LACTB